MAKETTYQRLKRENAELKESLREVCINPLSMKSVQIVAKQKLLQRRQDAFFMGDSQSRGPGLVDFIINSKEENTLSKYKRSNFRQ
jgi:hypothetical protein